MVLFTVERLDAAGPVFAVYASHRLSLEVGLDGLELRVGVMVSGSWHCGDESVDGASDYSHQSQLAGSVELPRRSGDPFCFV